LELDLQWYLQSQQRNLQRYPSSGFELERGESELGLKQSYDNKNADDDRRFLLLVYIINKLESF